jgi:hypothetical protein
MNEYRNKVKSVEGIDTDINKIQTDKKGAHGG